MIRLFTMLSVLLLVACKTVPPVYIPEPTDHLNIPTYALEKCGDLPLLVANEYNDLVLHYASTIELYGVCKDKQEAGISIIRVLTNK